MNGSMVEHNGLGITCFSVDIQRHGCLLICLSIEIFMSNIDYCFESSKKSKCPCSKRKEYMMNMLGRIPDQRFYFCHLPTRGRAGIKLGDADRSPTYL